jgi:copper chaperone
MNSTQRYAVTGMTCGHCESSVRHQVSTLPGVRDLTVSAAAGEVIITTSGLVSDDAVVRAVAEAGYTAPPQLTHAQPWRHTGVTSTAGGEPGHAARP